MSMLAEIAALKAEVNQLRKEVDTSHTADCFRLEQENERLRAALKGISVAAAGSCFDAERMKSAALRALA